MHLLILIDLCPPIFTLTGATKTRTASEKEGIITTPEATMGRQSKHDQTPRPQQQPLRRQAAEGQYLVGEAAMAFVP